MYQPVLSQEMPLVTTKSKVVWMEEGLNHGKPEFSECSPKVCFSPKFCLVCLDSLDDTSVELLRCGTGN